MKNILFLITLYLYYSRTQSNYLLEDHLHLSSKANTFLRNSILLKIFRLWKSIFPKVSLYNPYSVYFVVLALLQIAQLTFQSCLNHITSRWYVPKHFSSQKRSVLIFFLHLYEWKFPSICISLLYQLQLLLYFSVYG